MNRKPKHSYADKLTEANRKQLKNKVVCADAEIVPHYSETKEFLADKAELREVFKKHPNEIFTKGLLIRRFRDFREIQMLLNHLQSDGVIDIDRSHWCYERYNLAETEVSKLKPVKRPRVNRSFASSGAKYADIGVRN